MDKSLEVLSVNLSTVENLKLLTDFPLVNLSIEKITDKSVSDF
ncbi:hypothetical protein [Lactococcus lactis]|nr:hypothetical protein [Lactococcus lactis]